MKMIHVGLQLSWITFCLNFAESQNVLLHMQHCHGWLLKNLPLKTLLQWKNFMFVNILNLTTPLVFPKLYLLKRGCTLLFFVAFHIIISHIFPENFILIPQFAQEIWWFSVSILTIFINFYQFFGFFYVFLL